jgi:hypothetical protein
MATPTRATTWGALVLLTLAALVVRLVGIGFGVPVWEEPDSDIVGHVDMVRTGATLAAVEHPEQQYPHLITDIARWLPAGPRPDAAGAPRTLDENLHDAAWTYIQVRTVVAVIASMLVPLTFLLARKFVASGWALFAAALVAGSLLDQSFAQQARPHAVAATLFALAVLADMQVVRTGSWRAYIAAGIATALSLGSLHSGLATLVPGLAAHGLRQDGGKRRLDAKLAVSIALCVGAVFAFYPFLFEGQGPTATVDGEGVRQAEHIVSLTQFYGRGFRVVAQVMWNYEPALSVLLACALSVWIATRGKGPASAERGELWVVLWFVLPYLLVIGLFERTYERFVIPLLPFFAIFAAWGLQRASQFVPRKLVIAFAALALSVGAAATVKLAYLRSKPDTLGEVAQWIAALPEAATQRVYISPSPPTFDVPLFRQAPGLLLNGHRPHLPLTPWTAWQARVPDELAPAPRYDLRWIPRPPGGRAEFGDHIASLAPALFVIEPHEKFNLQPMLVAMRDSLRAHGTRVARFSPDVDPETTELELFFHLSDHFNEEEDIDWPHFTWRLLRARAIGPVVEVWRVERP